MTPASKGTQVKRVSGSGSASTASSRAGNNKTSSAKVAATAKKHPSPSKKKAVPVVKKATTATKKATPSAKKTAPAAPKKAAAPAAKKAAPAKKAATAPKKKAPAAKKTAPAKKSAAPAKKSTEKAVAKEVAPASGAAAPPPARTTFTPKPKPPPPVRPKTGPYAKDVKFLEEVRELLLADRAIYQEQATSLRAEADSLALEREPGDVQFDEESGEGGTVTVDRERNLALSGQAVLAVEEIDDALKRIADKTYGYCERCFQPIPKPRLRALPYARLCVACKSGGLSRR
ncbi:MAG: TraR/DksA C4-type zinc finger protein [Acidimicrobiales bacterium]